MSSFGDKLKRERESRNRTLEDLSGVTGIGQSYLEALEHNQFEALPGRAFGKLYIRAYADVLGFDPKPLIADYERDCLDRERMLPPEAWNANPILVPPAEVAEAARRETAALGERSTDGPSEEVAVAARPATAAVDDQHPHSPSAEVAEAPTEPAVPTPTGSPSPPVPVTAVVFFVLVAATAIYFVFLHGGSQPDPEATPASMPISEPVEPAGGTPPATLPSEPGEQAVVQDTAAATESLAAVPEASPVTAGTLRVSDFGVGRDRTVAERADRFEEGEVAWFSTRVLGGKRGQRIRHVWLREGKRMQSIELGIGSSNWGTQSYKTLWGTGAWTVEARDAEGRVLASASFTCVPRSR